MTLLELRTFVASRYRNTTDELNTVINSMINDQYQRLAKLRKWKQLIVKNATLTTAQDVLNYDLPADFWRFMPNSVRYDYISQQLPGTELYVISGDEVGVWRQSCQTLSPLVCAVQSGTSAPKAMTLLPLFYEYGKVILYDYQKIPPSLVSDSDETLVKELDMAIAWGALKDLAIYSNNFEQAAVYDKQLKEEWRTAFQTLTNN